MKSQNINMKKPCLINVTPLIPGYEKETAADLHELYGKGIVQAAIFSGTLVPEGNPASDKAARIADLYRKQKAAIGNPQMPTGVLIQALLGHGWVPEEQAAFQRFTYADGRTPYIFCPLDRGFLDYVRSSIRTIAGLKPDFFMIDDDTRMHTLRGGCFCPLHMAGFNQLSHRSDTPETLKKALLEDDALAEKWDRFQQQGLFDMMQMIRKEFDAVDPSIQGMFCCCGGDVRHAPEMAKLLAAKGEDPVLRINNAQYLYMHSKPAEMLDWMQLTANEIAHVPQNYCILAETDTCSHSRYCTSFAALHVVYAWSLLNGCSGGKLWITDLSEYTPSAGKFYRQKLEQYSAFYKAVHSMRPQWQGVVSPVLAYPKFNAAANPVGKLRYPNWNAAAFGMSGLPFAFAVPGKENVIALSGAEIDLLPDETIEKFLHQRVLLDGSAALALTKRGFAPKLGVKAEEDLPGASLEKTAGGVTMQRVPPCVKLTVLSDRAEVRSELYHSAFRHAPTAEKLAPGMVRFVNELGGTVLTAAGKLPESYGFDTAAFLNARRKAFLLRELGITTYYAGDAPLAMHAFTDRGVQTYCLFNLGLDILDAVELEGLPEDAKLQKLFPDGSWQDVPFVKKQVQTSVAPLELLFLRVMP